MNKLDNLSDEYEIINLKNRVRILEEKVKQLEALLP